MFMRRILPLLLVALCSTVHADVLKTIAAGATDQTVTVRIIDSTDGTPETGVAFNTSGIDLEYWRHGANSATDITEATQTVSGAHAEGGFVHIGHGVYRLDLPDAAVAAGATAVDVYGTVTGMIVIGGTVQLSPPVNAVQIGSQTASASGTVTFPNATLASTTNITAGTVTTATNVTTVNGLASGVITAASIATDAIGAAELAADAGTEIGTANWATTTRVLTAGTNIALAKGTGVTGFNDLDAAGVRTAVGLASANLDTQLGAIDDYVDTEVAAILVDTGTTLDDLVDDLESRLGTPSNLGGGATVAANLADIEGQTDDIGTAGAGLTAADDAVVTLLGTPAGASVSADIAAVEAQTDDIGAAGVGLTALASAANLATVDGVVDTIQATTDKLDDTLEDDGGTFRFTVNALEQAPSGGGGGSTDWTADERTAMRAILGIPGSGTTPADPTTGVLDTIRDAVGVVDGVVDTILVDTNELQGDWVNGGRLDLILDARASQTSMDDVPTNAELSTALGTADDAVLARLGTPAGASVSADIADLPTNSELATSQAGADDATLAAVAGLNNVSTAQVQTSATAALNAYDPPTRAEATSDANSILAAVAALNDLSTADVRGIVIEDQGGGISLGCALSVVMAYAAGDLVTSGGNSTYEDPSGTETRVTGTVTSAGNRTASVTCPSY
jgi:hypothetical protein